MILSIIKENYDPRRQIKLLLLWEAIACPFEDRKQEHGEELKIIGFWVNINEGSISLPQNSITSIIEKIDFFLGQTPR